MNIFRSIFASAFILAVGVSLEAGTTNLSLGFRYHNDTEYPQTLYYTEHQELWNSSSMMYMLAIKSTGSTTVAVGDTFERNGSTNGNTGSSGLNRNGQLKSYHNETWWVIDDIEPVKPLNREPTIRFDGVSIDGVYQKEMQKYFTYPQAVSLRVHATDFKILKSEELRDLGGNEWTLSKYESVPVGEAAEQELPEDFSMASLDELRELPHACLLTANAVANKWREDHPYLHVAEHYWQNDGPGHVAVSATHPDLPSAFVFEETIGIFVVNKPKEGHEFSTYDILTMCYDPKLIGNVDEHYGNRKPDKKLETEAEIETAYEVIRARIPNAKFYKSDKVRFVVWPVGDVENKYFCMWTHEIDDGTGWRCDWDETHPNAKLEDNYKRIDIIADFVAHQIKERLAVQN